MHKKHFEYKTNTVVYMYISQNAVIVSQTNNKDKNRFCKLYLCILTILDNHAVICTLGNTFTQM